MVTPELLDFIKAERESGMSVSEIKKVLLGEEGGWAEKDLAEAFRTLAIVDDTMPTTIVFQPKSATTSAIAASAAPARFIDPMAAARENSDTGPNVNISQESKDKMRQFLFEKTKQHDDFLGIFNADPASVPPPIVDLPSATQRQELNTSEHAEVAQDGVSVQISAPEQISSGGNLGGQAQGGEQVVTPTSIPTQPAPIDRGMVTHVFGGDDVFSQSHAALTTAHEPTPVPALAQIAEIGSLGKGQSIGLPETSPVASVMPAATPPPLPDVFKNFQTAPVSSAPASVAAVPPPSGLSSLLTGEAQPPAPALKFNLAALKKAEAEKPQPKPLAAATGPIPVTIAAPIPLGRTMASDLERTEVKPAEKPYKSLTLAEIALRGAREIPKEEPKTTPAHVIVPVESAEKVRTEQKPQAAISDLGSTPRGKGVGGSTVVLSATGMATVAAQREKRPFNSKPLIRIAMFTLGTLLMVGGALAAYFFLRPIATDLVFANAASRFLSHKTFNYQGTATVDLGFSRTEIRPDVANGKIKFALAFSGALNNSDKGFGDGGHRLRVRGGIEAGAFVTGSDMEAEMLKIGNLLYFHILALPNDSMTDQELLKTYWIKIDLETLARELASQGIQVTGGDYGGFANSGNDDPIAKLITENAPFIAGARVASGEEYNGVKTDHINLVADPEKMFALIRAVYKKYTNKDLNVSEDEATRLSDAFKKIGGEMWVDSATGDPIRLKITALLDDELFGLRVKGATEFAFDLSKYDNAVSADEPTPVLTMDELRLRLNMYQQLLELRAKDMVKINKLRTMLGVLAIYKKEHARYPQNLTELTGSDAFAATSLTVSDIKELFYGAYVNDKDLGKNGRCTTKSKTCDFYHIGINIDDMTNPALDIDADRESDVKGDDKLGCAGEKNVACYDIFSQQ